MNLDYENLGIGADWCGGIIGYITCSYDNLIKLFGKGIGSGDDYKNSSTWLIKLLENGNILRIYDYKESKLYDGKHGLDTKDITNWHIGGENKEDLIIFKKIIEKLLVNENIKVETFKERLDADCRRYDLYG